MEDWTAHIAKISIHFIFIQIIFVTITVTVTVSYHYNYRNSNSKKEVIWIGFNQLEISFNQQKSATILIEADPEICPI